MIENELFNSYTLWNLTLTIKVVNYSSSYKVCTVCELNAWADI